MEPRTGRARGGDRTGIRECLEVALHVVEIDAAALRSPLHRQRVAKRDPADLTRLLVSTVAGEDSPNLEYANARHLPVQVGAQRPDQPRQKRRAHDIHRRGNGIHNRDRLRIRVERALDFAGNEAERHDFLPVAKHEGALEGNWLPTIFGARQHVLDVRRRLGRDRIEAVNARDFLDEVFFECEVEAIRRRGDREAVAIARWRELEPTEDLIDRFRRDRETEQARDARRANPDWRTRGQGTSGVDERSGLAAADREDQLRRALDATRPELEVDAALE